MKGRLLISCALLAELAVLAASCVRGMPPQPRAAAPGQPAVSWVVMSGDRDNPDREFVCQSDPHSDCTIPASRPDAQVFSDVHLYYHSGGGETKYEGTIRVGFFDGSPASQTTPTSIVVKKGESIANQGIIGIVTSKAGSYDVSVEVTATVAEGGRKESIRRAIPIVVN